MENNENTFLKLEKIQDYLFPSEKLNLEIKNLNLTISSKIGKTILLSLFILFITGILSIIFIDEYEYIIVTLLMYIVMLFMSVNIIVINIPKQKVFKEQIALLKLDEEKYKKEIILHQNFKKYKLKWNIIYGLIIFLAMSISINLFITDLIKAGNTTMGPIFASFVVMIILGIPAASVNYFAIKSYLKKQLIIIEQTF